jgi:hypothetical protein
MPYFNFYKRLLSIRLNRIIQAVSADVGKKPFAALKNDNVKGWFQSLLAENRLRTGLLSCLLYRMLRFLLNKQLLLSEK